MSRRISVTLCLVVLCAVRLTAGHISGYHIVWNTQSENSSGSMPCGGGDTGMNVWVENGDILFYFSRSGAFDEHNTLLKLGRVRIRLHPNPFEGESFSQELKLEDGHILIKGRQGDIAADVRIWADVFNPVINVDIVNNRKLKAEVCYENWRYRDRPLRKGESNQNSYKWAAPEGLVTKKDEISFDGDRILFYHRNTGETIFDVAVEQQGLGEVKGRLYNPLENLTFGGFVEGKGLKPAGTSSGVYAGTDYEAWKLESRQPQKDIRIKIQLHTAQSERAEDWKQALYKPLSSDLKRNVAWWRNFWERSYIHIQPAHDKDKGYEVGRNYQLFRYMLACNAYGQYPTKFNGGLFTCDPVHVDTVSRFTPDFRKWGGGVHTAQNQRLVYFPMLKSGDTDMMTSQFEFYKRLLPAAELRSRVYWGHEGACFTEQMENFGLPNPSEYGWKRPGDFDKGMEYNAWLEYQWDTALEFCFMIMESNRYTGRDITEYMPLIESTLIFFDEHYRYLAKQRGQKALNEEGKLVLYPGSACETYKMAYNATSTIAALQTVGSRLLELLRTQPDTMKTKYFTEFMRTIPDIRLREIDGHRAIAPAWLWERINNTESPQLYPVFPWGMYGVGKPGLDIALNTWRYDQDVIHFRSHTGWKQDAIWAARLGLVEEAKDLSDKKLESSGTRFPAFWGPGYDWTPDHNWGGSGMIALQEMLMQTDDDKILLLPCWDKSRDVHFKLHAPRHTTVECKLEKGEITFLKVLPKERGNDVVVASGFTNKMLTFAFRDKE